MRKGAGRRVARGTASDDAPAVLARLEEERRFRPIHAADILARAHSKFDRAAAVAKIVQLVAKGYEGRGMVVRVEVEQLGRRRAVGGRGKCRGRKAAMAC